MELTVELSSESSLSEGSDLSVFLAGFLVDFFFFLVGLMASANAAPDFSASA